MCGIAGILTPGRPVDAEVLGRMVAAMTHRGPDDEGRWTGDGVGLGMRRLAIVDVPGGAQPLRNEEGSVRVVFNGEIYNHRALRDELAARGHRFASDTDGEVIAHLWEEHGPRGVARLDGIFALALWDDRRRALLLARDQLGVKPLYLHRRGSEVRFASELKALLADPAVERRLDLAALDAHLTLRFTPAPLTLLQGVEKLEPATWMLIDAAGERRVRYWDPAPVERTDLTLEEAAAELRDRLRAAVRRQMMSDRPIGAMLSGGIDSAAVVAFMAEASPHVRTFTIGFEGGGDADETALARATARHFGTEHHDVVLPAGGFREELPAVIEMLEEPVGTTSAIGVREVARLARSSVPVLLSGQGADELLAGYWRYVGEAIAARGSAAVRRLGLRPAVAAAAARARPVRLQRGLQALCQPETLERFLGIYAVFDPQRKRDLYGPELAAALSGRSRQAEAVERLRARAAERDSVGQMLYVDTRLWLPDDLLLIGDKMAMAESVELRVPFLDRELVEFAESLPTAFKLRRGVRKLVHRRAMEHVLPAEIVHRRERGFQTPMQRWLRGPEMGDYARELLLDGGGVCAGLLRRGAVEAMLDRHRSGAADHTRQLFCLISLELWGRRFLTAPPVPPRQPRPAPDVVGAGPRREVT
jgi:asparagine synthase (glutamine-hydrolysing)